MKIWQKYVLTSLIMVGVTACTSKKTDSPNLNTKKSPEKLRPRVIYGEDNRLDLHQVEDPLVLDLASSTAAIVRRSKVHVNGNGMTRLDTIPYAQYYNLCPQEPFYQQSILADCSGFLVGPNLLATAGHCVMDEKQCAELAIVFGYANRVPASQAPAQVPSEDVYFCRRILARDLGVDRPDFALIELDRVVSNRMTLKVRRSGELQTSESVFVIGHPAGLPTKVAAGATVRQVNPLYFTANLDTYGGNSGSAVFNSRTGEVEGILVRGQIDYKYKDGCRISNVCSDEGCYCKGEKCLYEEVTNIGALTPHLAE